MKRSDSSNSLNAPSYGEGVSQYGVSAEHLTYEDYLDTHVAPQDLYYLENQDLARQIVELGYKGKNLMERSQFEEQKKKSLEGPRRNKKKSEKLSSHGKDFSNYPLLHALAKREAFVRNGKLSTIIFIRDIDKSGHEVSGYIDYGHRLKTEQEFEEYFSRKKKFMPKPSDLSYYNWKTQTLFYNNSNTFQVIADSERGLLFKHRRDRKTIDVDPKGTNPGDNSTRKVIKTDEYLQVVIYEHRPRRKN
ncbi:hypothetical protein AKO1_013789 [Acrasis kona]|uniref:Cilia- and flagella-associated protein 299 n=1 Tax=Acrasis kona TaxID=1008807 RepID=A0AAW2ZHI4_9EUKA